MYSSIWSYAVEVAERAAEAEIQSQCEMLGEDFVQTAAGGGRVAMAVYHAVVNAGEPAHAAAYFAREYSAAE